MDTSTSASNGLLGLGARPSSSVSHPSLGSTTARTNQPNHVYAKNNSSTALDRPRRFNPNKAADSSEDSDVFYDTRSTAPTATPMYTADNSLATATVTEGDTSAYESLDGNWPSLNSHCYATAEEEEEKGGQVEQVDRGFSSESNICEVNNQPSRDENRTLQEKSEPYPRS